MRSAWNTQHNLDNATPAEPLKCMWMLAGIVDYKLCHRQYECEDCAFDRALRERAPSHLRQASAALKAPVLDWQPRGTVRDQAMEMREMQGYKLGGALFYDPGHIWARVEDGGRVRIGLDDFGQKLVGRIYSVHLLEPGARVTGGGACWRIAHRVGETTLAAPVTGIVGQLNEKLALHPSLINHDPYGRGWAMLIQPAQLVESLEHLYYGRQVERWYEQEIEKLHGELRNLMKDAHPDVGVTLQDGGLRIEDLSRVISASQLRRIIDTFLSAPTSGEQRAESEERRAVALSSKPDALRCDGGAGR